MEQPLKNLAETLAEVLPKAAVVHEIATGVPALTIARIAAPKGTEIRDIEVDLEKHLANPRRTKAKASFSTAASFLAYVARHANEGTVCWCEFDPQTFGLQFTAVIDEHIKGLAGWREHRATLKPEFAAEWKAWKGMDTKPFPQVQFAEWIEAHSDDIATANGLPTALQMLQMATDFTMNEERVLKSAVKLQSGGARLTYIADPDKGTTEAMEMFSKFGLGIPVFHGGPAWSVGARLKYRNNSGKLAFHFELVRPDRVHQGAAEELIGQVRDGLGGTPLLMGVCN